MYWQRTAAFVLLIFVLSFSIIVAIGVSHHWRTNNYDSHHYKPWASTLIPSVNFTLYGDILEKKIEYLSHKFSRLFDGSNVGKDVMTSRQERTQTAPALLPNQKSTTDFSKKKKGWIYNTHNLSVYDAPGVNNRIIEVITELQEFEIIVETSDGDWYLIEYEHRNKLILGWVKKKFVYVTKN